MALSNKYVAKAIYDFDVDGTASGDITLAQTETIPAGAVVTSVVTNETTALTGSDDIDIQIGSLTVVSGEDFTSSSGVTAHTTLAAEVATAGDINIRNEGSAITAGVVEIFVEYYF